MPVSNASIVKAYRPGVQWQHNAGILGGYFKLWSLIL